VKSLLQRVTCSSLELIVMTAMEEVGVQDKIRGKAKSPAK
jgi:hypothetical protein